MATEIGTVLDGKYEILTEVGRGGMSIVYLARDNRLNKQWAVKEIKKTSNGKNDDIVVNSLLAEANLMKRLDHPALPRIVDIIDDGETIYVIMDYIEGQSLDKILQSYGPQPEETVISWAMQLCDALSYLHSQNPPVIYRDMKPANVMLKPEGNLKVIDFGIAREYKGTSKDTTILGTRGYAPPEQYGARETDGRSDIYSLGMTMHYLLTGIDPMQPGYEYHSVRYYNPNLSDGIEAIVDKCTQIDAENRYQNCAELMYDLEHPEIITQDFKNRQKRKIRLFAVSLGLAVFFLMTGVTGQVLHAKENDKDYEAKIGISTSTPYDVKVQSYLDAIDLYGTDVRGYQKLLEAYRDNGTFGDVESEQFTGKYNINQDAFVSDSDEYLDMVYEAGITYLYLYSGGDNTFRTRVLKAYPYFQTIMSNAGEGYHYRGMAESYGILGQFYTDYVVNATSIKEPTKEAYEELLSSLEVCIGNMDEYDYDDAAYIKLTMYSEIVNLLNDHRKGFASTGIGQGEVQEVLDTVRKKVDSLSVTQQTSIDLRDSILDMYQQYTDSIRRAYDNTEEMNQ